MTPSSGILCTDKQIRLDLSIWISLVSDHFKTLNFCRDSQGKGQLGQRNRFEEWLDVTSGKVLVGRGEGGCCSVKFLPVYRLKTNQGPLGIPPLTTVSIGLPSAH